MAKYTYRALTTPDAKPIVMDPALQRAIACKQGGQRKPATANTQENEIAVVARVTNEAAWRTLSEVLPGTQIPTTNSEWIVTGRVPIQRLEFVRAQPFVKSLKAARRLHPGLAAGVPEIMASPAQLPVGARSGGKGVVVGIVDFGCDFAHRNFLDAQGRTRLKLIWDQDAPTIGTGVPFGRLMRDTEINAALAKANPYIALGYRPTSESHGTHVMDIAAGSDSATPGVAPNADLMFVHIASSDIPWSGVEALGKNFGDSVQLLEALQFIFTQAGTQPCVINVSLGTNGGPHDGSSLVEQGIDSLIRQQPNRAVVIAASNSFTDKIHAQGTVAANSGLDLRWQVGPLDRTDNELELWYPGDGRLDVELIDPNGQSLGRIPPNEAGSISDDQNRTVVFVANRLDDPNNHDNTIGIFLAPTAVAGTWTVRLHNTGASAVPLHAWIERDDGGQSSFLPNPGQASTDNSHTLGSISCGQETIVVGSYDAHQPGAPLSFFTSAGPTRDGRLKPELSAPGHNVLAANAETKTGRVRMSGTSMAAPMVTGTIALMLAEARRRGRNLVNGEIRQILQSTARTNPPSSSTSGWDPRYGFGRIAANAAVMAVMQTIAPAVGSVTSLATVRRARIAQKRMNRKSPRPPKKPRRGLAGRPAAGGGGRRR